MHAHALMNSNGNGHGNGHRHGEPMHGHDDDYGQGQSGYGAGRFADDRSLAFRNRNQGMRPGEHQEHERAFGFDDRFSGGRGGEDYAMERGMDRDHDRDQHWTDREHRDIGREMPRESGGYYSGDRQWGRGDAQGEGRERARARSWNPQDTFRGQRMNPVSHAGKGPKGYQRSDERIREHVCEVLTDSHDIDATHIEVTVKNGDVILSGTVEDRNTKRMAEDHVWQLSGVKDVQNNLKVGNPSSSAGVGRNETEMTTPNGGSKHRA